MNKLTSISSSPAACGRIDILWDVDGDYDDGEYLGVEVAMGGPFVPNHVSHALTLLALFMF